MFALIAGGGTAGHLTPGLAVAGALRQRGHAAGALHFVGAERGIEGTVVPAEGLPLTVLPGRGLQRRLTTDNLGAIGGTLVAVRRARSLVARTRPRVVLATGGYASVPCALAAAAHRVPIVVAEQNAVAGLANRLTGRLARACAVAFDGTDLPRAVLTGNPVRAEILEVDRSRDQEAARALLGVRPGRPLVLVFGGSLGARRLNEAVLELAEGPWARGGAGPGGELDVDVRHVIGRRDWDTIGERARRLAERRPGYVGVAYEDDMATCLAAADVALCRAGASTVAELAVVGLASVLVPLPGAPGDHQTANARALERVGAAVVVSDHELRPDHLSTVLGGVLRDRGRRDDMAARARAVGRRDAAERVADLVEEHATGD